MNFAVLILGLLAAPCAANADAKNRPVSKVITLLNDMTKQLETEAKEDEETFDAMMCWCETNDKGKTKAIADGEASIAELEAAIQSFTALSSKLTTEIANLEKEVAENTEALADATGVRKKELAEFNAEEKSSLATISSLKGAVAALSKHQSASFLQTESADEGMDFITKVTELKFNVHKHQDLLSSMLNKRQKKVLSSFVQAPEDFLENGGIKGQTALLQTAAPSSQIFGVLKQMKEGFETNLAASQKEEMKAQGEYEDVKHGKEEEIAAGTAQIDTKTNELADSDEKNAQSKKLLAETRATLDADTKFLANLKEQCVIFQEQMEERTKTRQLEIQAVSKAAAFLSSDEAQDLVSRTFSFIQTSRSSKRNREKFVKALNKLAIEVNDPRISALAIHARLDAFTKVKKSIQDMIDTLAKEQEDEVQHKDFCVDELQKNEKETQSKEQEKNTLEENIEDLAALILKLKNKIAELKANIANLQVQLKRAGEDREKENSEFQVTVADQRATQKLLAGALNILKGFYDKAALLQTSSKQPAGPPPPPGFKTYGKSAQSGGVMAMIEQIIADAKAMESDALKAEEEAQVAYETFVTETNASIDAATKESVTCAENQAKAEAQKVETEMARDGVADEISALISENADLHKSCDYTLKNFDLRQGARQSEMEALKQALSILSGASFGAFVQTVKI